MYGMVIEMELPGARVGDFHVCPAFDGPVPHVGGPVLPPGAPTVLVGGLPAARIGDLAQCVGPPDVVSSGVATVLIGGKPAARMTDSCAHGGAIILGCPTVLIGPGSGGAVALTPPEVREALSAGAFPGQQHYNNCGVQSSQQIVFLSTGQRPSEDEILQKAIQMGVANPGTKGVPDSMGGTTAAGRQKLLAQYGVQSSVVPTNEQNLSDAINDGKGVIVAVEAGTLWQAGQPLGGHAVVVTGGTFAPDGRLDTVTVNDTGTGQHHQLPASQLLDAAAARKGGSLMNVTNQSIFP